VLHAVAVGRADAHPDAFKGAVQVSRVLRVAGLVDGRVLVEQLIVLPKGAAVAQRAVLANLQHHHPLAGQRPVDHARRACGGRGLGGTAAIAQVQKVSLARQGHGCRASGLGWGARDGQVQGRGNVLLGDAVVDRGLLVGRVEAPEEAPDAHGRPILGPATLRLGGELRRRLVVRSRRSSPTGAVARAGGDALHIVRAGGRFQLGLHGVAGGPLLVQGPGEPRALRRLLGQLPCGVCACLLGAGKLLGSPDEVVPVPSQP